MTREEILKEFKILSERILNLEKKVFDYIEVSKSELLEEIDGVKEDVERIKNEVGIEDGIIETI